MTKALEILGNSLNILDAVMHPVVNAPRHFTNNTMGTTHQVQRHNVTLEFELSGHFMAEYNIDKTAKHELFEQFMEVFQVTRRLDFLTEKVEEKSLTITPREEKTLEIPAKKGAKPVIEQDLDKPKALNLNELFPGGTLTKIREFGKSLPESYAGTKEFLEHLLTAIRQSSFIKTVEEVNPLIKAEFKASQVQPG